MGLSLRLGLGLSSPSMGGGYLPETLAFVANVSPEPGGSEKRAIDNAFREIASQGGADSVDVLAVGEYQLSGYTYAVTDEDYRIMAPVQPTVTPPVDPVPESFVAEIAMWGDSRVASFGLPAALAAALPGVTVHNFGVSGSTSREITARQGGRKAKLTLSGNAIPASGAVSVTAYDVNPVPASFDAFTLQFPGELQGVPGMLTDDGSGNLSFTRTTAGSAVASPPEAEFTCTPYSRAGVVVTDHRRMLNIFWCEMNTASFTTIVADNYERSIAYLTAAGPRAIVIGPSTQSSWVTGDARQGNFQQFRSQIASQYAGRTVDPWAILRANGNGGTDDNADIANGIQPRSLMSDATHQNSAGSALIAAALASLITSQGLLS